jgi:hypothetical protein
VSVVIVGKRLCGKVDRVPELFYVSTMFFHIDYVPLFPVSSYLVFEGTEQGEQFRGTQIKMSGKSVLAGFLRGWLGIATIIAAGIASFAMASIFFGRHESYSVVALFAMVATVCGAFFFVLASSKRAIYPVLGILIAASVAVWFGCYSRVQVDAAFRLQHGRDLEYLPALLVANGAAFLYTLTRLMLPASYSRALALAEIAGLPREVIEGIYHDAETAQSVEDDPYADQSWMEQQADARHLG